MQKTSRIQKRAISVLIMVLIGLLVKPGLSAQEVPGQAPLRLGIGFFGVAFDGDLTVDGEKFYRFNPGFNASLQFASRKLITPQLNAGFGKFVAQNRDIAAVEGVQPNTFVETSFFYVDFRLKLKFFRKKNVNPYGSIGASLLGFTPRDQNDDPLIDNFPTRNEGETYGTITAAFPLSLGLDIHLNPLLGLNLEYTYRPVGNDYLDNIGELGTMEGNDKLHTFLLGMYVTFDPEGVADWRRLKGRDRR